MPNTGEQPFRIEPPSHRAMPPPRVYPDGTSRYLVPVVNPPALGPLPGSGDANRVLDAFGLPGIPRRR